MIKKTCTIEIVMIMITMDLIAIVLVYRATCIAVELDVVVVD